MHGRKTKKSPASRSSVPAACYDLTRQDLGMDGSTMTLPGLMIWCYDATTLPRAATGKERYGSLSKR